MTSDSDPYADTRILHNGQSQLCPEAELHPLEAPTYQIRNLIAPNEEVDTPLVDAQVGWTYRVRADSLVPKIYEITVQSDMVGQTLSQLLP